MVATLRTEVWKPGINGAPGGDSFESLADLPSNELIRAAGSYRQFRMRQGDDVDFWDESLLAGENGIDLFRDFYRAEPESADRLARALTDMPVAGSKFLNFELIQELGRGAFGRVFLARQGDL